MITISTRPLDMNELFQVAKDAYIDTCESIAKFKKANLSPARAQLDCTEALSDCAQSLLMLLDEVQMLYITELMKGSAAVEAIVAADAGSARNIAAEAVAYHNGVCNGNSNTADKIIDFAKGNDIPGADTIEGVAQILEKHRR